MMVGMNLHALLLAREARGRPVTVGLIGAGKFGTMFLAQARSTPGLHVLGIADLDVGHAKTQLRLAGWGEQEIAAASLGNALASRRTTRATPFLDGATILASGCALLAQRPRPGDAIRLLGLGVSGPAPNEEPRQLGLPLREAGNAGP